MPIFLLTLLALADQPAIRGQVFDPMGATIRQASIRIVQPDTKAILASATADEKGAFEIGSLNPGTYELTARAIGFRLRVLTNITVHRDETTDLGKLQLELIGCDAPGVICDTFGIEPVFPGLIHQGRVTVRLDCGADLTKGTASCPPSPKADLKFVKDGATFGVMPVNGASIYAFPADNCKDQTRTDLKIRVHGFGQPGLDFCVRRRDGSVSHVYVENDVSATNPELLLWLTTTKRP